MREFFIKGAIFILINVFLIILFLGITQNLYVHDNANSEAHLFSIFKNKNYDLLILGASHGRVFSSTENHSRIEKILSKNILNLSKTSAGVLPEKIYLSYFYNRNNSTDQVVYFLDPFIMYSDRWNEKNYFLEDEPVSLPFLFMSIGQGISKDVIFNYLRSKFSYFWVISRKPEFIERQDMAVSVIDQELQKKRKEILYPDGLGKDSLGRYFKILEETVVIANNNGNKVLFIITPTILGETPGKNELEDALAKMEGKMNFSFYDLSESMSDPVMFQDHDHLNTVGVEFFTENYLKPILDANF